MFRLFVCLIIPMILLGSVEVYNVDPYENCNVKVDHSGIQQEIVITCDSVVSLYAFLGEPKSGTYYLRIIEIPDAIVQIPDPGGWQWIGGNLQNPKKASKGKLYTLWFYHSEDSVNYYYDPTNPYPYGEIDGQSAGWDLAARVYGRNDTCGDYFGMCFDIRNI